MKQKIYNYNYCPMDENNFLKHLTLLKYHQDFSIYFYGNFSNVYNVRFMYTMFM